MLSSIDRRRRESGLFELCGKSVHSFFSLAVVAGSYTQHGRAIQTVLPEVLHISGTCEADLAAVSRRFSIRDGHIVFGVVVVANPTSCGQTV
jgi:hypothetical protein